MKRIIFSLFLFFVQFFFSSFAYSITYYNGTLPPVPEGCTLESPVNSARPMGGYTCNDSYVRTLSVQCNPGDEGGGFSWTCYTTKVCEAANAESIYSLSENTDGTLPSLGQTFTRTYCDDGCLAIGVIEARADGYHVSYSRRTDACSVYSPETLVKSGGGSASSSSGSSSGSSGGTSSGDGTSSGGGTTSSGGGTTSSGGGTASSSGGSLGTDCGSGAQPCVVTDGSPTAPTRSEVWGELSGEANDKVYKPYDDLQTSISTGEHWIESISLNWNPSIPSGSCSAVNMLGTWSLDICMPLGRARQFLAWCYAFLTCFVIWNMAMNAAGGVKGN